MKFALTRQSSEKISCDCLVVGIYKDGGMTPDAQVVNDASGGLIRDIVKRNAAASSVGSLNSLHSPSKVTASRVLLLGLGDPEKLDARNFVRAIGRLAGVLASGSTGTAAIATTGIDVQGHNSRWLHRQLAMQLEAATYQYRETKPSAKARKTPLRTVRVLAGSSSTGLRDALGHGHAIASGQALTRRLGDLPPNRCTPEYLARQARALARSDKRFSVKVLGPAELKKLGMGALLAVAQGSDLPPRLIVIDYRGANSRARPPIALVGKGVTFDTGGISIKPSHAMDEMKYDMCGAGSVLGTLSACAQLNLPQRLIGIIPTVENMPGGHATRPGDVVTSASGQTVEILNTDAEGRLILCDALHYARRYKPRIILDIATLTGACVAALGRHASGVFSKHIELQEKLVEAGVEAWDRVWPLPLWDDYQSELDSNFADIANIGSRYAGATTAACFLSRFTGDIPWAHLDIAGTAWKTGKKKGATGRPVPLLVSFLMRDAAEA